MTSSKNGSSESLNIKDDLITEISGPQNLNCNATTTISSEAGRVRLYCTEKKRHRGDHYDTIFSVSWPRMKRNSG